MVRNHIYALGIRSRLNKSFNLRGREAKDAPYTRRVSRTVKLSGLVNFLNWCVWEGFSWLHSQSKIFICYLLFVLLGYGCKR